MTNKFKTILLFSVFSVLFVSFVIYNLNQHSKINENLIKSIVTKEAIAHFNTIVATREWNALHGGVYVKQKGDMQPNVYLQDNYTYTKENELLIKVNPAWMMRQISEISNVSNKNKFKLTSLEPLNPINMPNDFEIEALNFFEKNKNVPFYFKDSLDFKEFNFMGSLHVQPSCLECHPNYKEGDIRGGISITIPTQEYYEKINELKKNHELLILMTIILSIILYILLIYIINKLFNDKEFISYNLKNIENLQEENQKILTRYKYAIKGTKDGLWDWDLTENTVYYSHNWKNMLGYNTDEIKNRFSSWEDKIHTSDKKQFLSDIKNNHNKTTENFQNIHRLRHKDGSWVWILSRAKTYFNNNNRPIRMVGFNTDITQLKELELLLGKKELELTHLRTVIENAPISILITDIKGNIVYVNDKFCKISSYKEDEILYQNPKILKYHDEDDKDKIFDLWNTITKKKTWGGIFHNQKKDGDEYWVTATILPVLDENKNIINYLGIMREITKEVYLQKALKEKEELMLNQSKSAAMGEMISMIAHQWRQPISTISMSANNILVDIELESLDMEETKKIAQLITQQTQFLSETIDDFRNFFKRDSARENTKVKEIFDELDSIFSASLANNDIKLNLEYKKDSYIYTYKRDLMQVLLNLIKNAKEAFSNDITHEKKINIYINDTSSSVIIDVIDNAGGIPQDTIGKIFDAYFTTKDEHNGTGLGLYMSRMIVEKHLNGTIKARNVKDGMKFTIKLKKQLEQE
ncbi:MAG: PAS domain S-box protein [Arcobacteraceae bacterium]